MDHIDTCLMTATLEFGIQPCIHNCFCSLTAYNSGTESNDICVVMFFYETGCYRLGTYCRTYPFYFVCSDGDTDTGSTDQHTTVRFTCCYHTSGFLAVLRIITAVMCICTDIDHLMTFLFQICLDLIFQFYCCMVITNYKFHCSSLRFFIYPRIDSCHRYHFHIHCLCP